MKQTNWTQMFNKKSTNTPLILRNCASKNSLKPLFKVNVQAKISLRKGVFVLFLLSTWVRSKEVTSSKIHTLSINRILQQYDRQIKVNNRCTLSAAK